MATNPFLQDPLTKLATDLEAEAAQPLPGQQAAAPTPVQAEVPQAKAAAATEPAAPAAEAPVEGRRPTRAKSMLPPPQLQPTFDAAAKQYNVPVNVLMALGQQESNYNATIIGQPTKWGRAKGMMQYLDSTAAGLGINPLNPDEAIGAAAKQLRERLDKGYSMEDAVKEHFAGPDRKLWGSKTAAYGREVMQKTAQIGDLLGASTGATAQSPELQQQLDAEEPGRYKVLPAGYAQNNQSAAMPRDTYLRTFRQNNPNASPAAIEQAMAQYDKTKARAPAMQGITVPDSPEAFFDQRLNQRLQGPANGIVPGLPGVLTRQQQDDADFLNIGTKTNAPTGVAANAADVGKGLKVGLNTAAQDVRELVGRIPVIGQPIVRGGDAVDQFFTGKDSGKLLADDSKAMTESMTPEMQSALKKKWYDSESGKMGPAWSDWRSYTGGLVQSLPEQALTMGPAMKLAKMAYTAKIAAGATAEVAALSAARTAQVAGSLAEGALGGAQSAREVREDVMALSPEVLAQSDAFKSLVASGLSPADAQKALAEDVATRAFVTSGLVTGAFGGMGDRAIAKLFAQKIGKSAVTGALKGFGKGAIAEGLFEELPQSMGQRLSQNEAMQKADPTRELSNDVINQGLGGAVLGGLQGGGMGAVAGARGSRPSPEQEIATEINRQVNEVNFVGGDAAARAAMDPNNEAVDPATTRKPAPPSQTPAAPADSAPPAPPSGKPLTDALNSAAEQPQRVVVDTPGGPVAGTLQAYQEDAQGGFTAQVVDDNGQVVTISDTDGVVITPVSAPVGPLTAAVEDVAAKHPEAAPTEQAAPITPVEQAAQVAPTPEPTTAPEPRQPAAQQAVADMSDAELRSRLKYVAGQAKQSGWDKRFMEARREIEREINQRAATQKKEAAAAAAAVVEPTEFTDRADANAAMLRAAERENKVYEVVESGDKFKIQPYVEVKNAAGTVDGNGRRGSDRAAGGNEPAVGNGSVPAGDAGRRLANVGAADRADEQRDATGVSAADPAAFADASLKDAHAGKWFGSQEKADAYVAKKKAGATHEVVKTGKVRFEVKPRSAAPAPDLAGKVIDKEWTAFAADSGTLNIDRAEMPQVKAEHRGALVNYLNARGIAHEQAEVAAGDLKPTQREFSPGKVAKAKAFDGGDRSILISSDNHVLDGHHQWLAKREDGAPVKVIRLDAPIKQLLDEVKDFPSAQAAAGATAPSAAPAEKVPEVAPPTDGETKPASIFADNKLFTSDRVAAARKRMKSKLGTTFAGLDPELVMDGVTLAGAYIEAGTRKFSAYAKAMTDDFGDAIKPYLLSFYEAARHYPGLDTDGMSTPEVAKKQHDAMLADQPTPAAAPVEAPRENKGKSREVKNNVAIVDDELLEIARAETSAIGDSANWKLKYDIEEDQAGVIKGKPTTINRSLKSGKYSEKDIADAWPKTRQLLRSRYGDKVTLFRADAPEGDWNNDTSVVYMADEKVAKQFERPNRPVKKFTVPVSDVLGLNAQKNGYYEFIVKRQGEPIAARTLRTVFEQAIKTNAMPKDNPALRKMVEAFDGKPSDSTRMKQAQEIMEAAIAQVAREIVAKKEGVRTTFDVLQRLYESQPNLNIRTSTSIENQAYSTPAPLAFLASQLAGISKTDTVLEPTAGTGLLLIEAAPSKAVVNELEPFRAELLREQGFTVTEKDATEQLPVAKPVDAVITNPPFGSIKGADGKPVKVKVDGYSLGQIDHLIAARALADMKDGGRATLILGANKVQGGISNADLIFFNWLYSHYNVTGHFEVEGDLYQRQGAGWPVRVISINGRASSGKVSPAAGTVPRAKNWSEVYEQFTNSMDAGRQSVGAAAQASVRDSFVEAETGSVSKPAGAKAVAAGQPGRASGPAGAGTVAGAVPGTVADRGGKPAEPVGSDAGAKRVDAAPAGADRVEQAGKPAAAKAAKPDGDRRATVSENQFQASYVPRSARKDEGVLIPVNMAGPTQEALSKLEDEVGDIDAYAAKELGYKSTADLHKAFMGLQVDSVASAIYQIKRGKGVVVADQTGIGKGRQAAAIIRWAVKNGHVPVFVTVKPSLFTDMYGDLADIGTDDVKPFIMNSSESIKGPSDEKLFANKPATHRRNIDRIAGGQLPDGANAIFMTYSQINVANAQRAAIMGIADNAVFILDESHNAGGESATGEFVQSVLALAKGVTYLSATYAKRPDNMPVYFKTDIGDAVADSATLMGAMEAGGLPLQTVVSNNLVRAGQMFRRERSYDGVNIESRSDTGRRAQHEKLSNETTLALRAIVDADKRFHEGFVMDAKIAAEKDGARVLDNAGNQAGESVNHTEFSSVVHNFVRQMLMGLKAQAAADEAIASLARGEKPLIALENTMGSFLAEYAENNNLKAGDKLGAFDYRTVLSRALDRTRYITRQLPNGDKVKEYIPLKDLDPVTRESYVEAQKVIDALKLDIPVSPLDWMRNEIAKAGYSVAEITGRNLSVDYSDTKNPVLSSIDPTEQKDKVATTRKFNDGRLDAIILNVAGSTGISLHSSERFADQRQRHMIVAQPAQDINIFMQMLGRIHRTGQVNLPKYTILNVDLPAEKRPTALLSKKMKSLNANTSSNTESATSVKSADMLNKYGDQIIGQFLADNMDLSRSLGITDPMTEQGPMEDVARKATGRLALMPVETQIAFYDEVESQYNSLMEYLNKTNQNDLEPRTFDFDAKELKQAVLFEGANPSSPFGEDAIYGEYSVKAQGKAMTPTEIRAGIETNLAGATAADHVAAMKQAGMADYKALTEKMEPERASGEEQVARNTLAFMREHPIGSAFRVEINGDVYNAIVTNLRSTHKGRGNPFSLSKVQLTVALNGALRSISVPATQFKRIEVSALGKATRIDDLFAVQPDNQRETAKIITGNLLAAYGEIAGVKGTVISFTKADGSQEQGILMPKIFDFTKNTVGDYRLRTGADAYKFLMDGNDPNLARFGIATRDGVVRVTPNGKGIQIQVPKSKAKGGKYFLDESLRAIVGDFISSGSHMVAKVEQGKAAAAMDALMRKQALYASASMAEGAKAMFAEDAPKFSVSARAQTETPAFKKWFGDSKVIDEEGNPLVVYHGTSSDFDTFSRELIGSSNAMTPIGSGFFFAKDKTIAGRYASGDGANVMPVFLSIQNPAPDMAAFTATGSAFDGFINSKIAVVRSSEQIKSAIGNNGYFDASNHDIRNSVGARSSTPLTAATLRTSITDGALGPVVGSLIDAGLIVLHETPATLPRNVGNQAQDIQAVTTPDGKVHLVASALSAGNARAVMLHEAFHQGGEKLIGTQQWDALMRRAGQLYRQANQSQGKAKEFFDKARERVYSAYRKGAVEPHMEVEEFAAYAIEEYESAPMTVRKWIDDLIGMVKAWALKRFGKQLGALTPAQLSALAKMAVLDVAATRRGEVFGKKGDWFSVAGDTRADPAPAPSPTPTPGPAPAPVDADLTPPEQGRLRKVQAALQNNMNRLRQVQDRIEKLAGAPMRESVDYYGAETNRPGRVAARLEDAERQLTGPLMERLAKSKHTQEQLSELLHAMHAQERNEKIAEFNQDMPDGGSGMTTAEADRILDKYAAARELHAIADQAREIAAATLDLKLAYGLINDEDHKQLTEVYDNYVPLKGDGEFGPKIKRAMGHDAREEHILENLSRDYNQAVIVGEKNLARQSLLRMVLANPDPDLWTVGVPPKGRRIVKEGGFYVTYKDGIQLGQFKTELEAQRQSELWAAMHQDNYLNYEISKATGEKVSDYIKPLQDNEIMVYVKGSPVRIQIKDTQLAAQLRPLDQGKMNPILEFMRGTNRYLSKIYTGYNPAFILRNASRDAMTGTISMLGNNGAAIAAKAWSKYPGAVKALGQWAATGKVPDGKTGAYLTEYRMHGGKVGASWMSDLEANGKKLSTMYEDAYGATNYAKDGRPTKAAIVAGRKIVGGMAHIVEIANQATENALRLSLYMAMREKGATPGKAAQAAKTVTVDFDRKGTMTGAMGGIYLFFNPAVQGTANALKTLSKGAHKEQAWAALGSLALLGAYLASRGMDDDRDRWLGEGWETRSKNMIWNVGSHQIRVPVSQEYAPAFSLGMALAEAARGESKMKASARILSSFLDAYFPLQGAHIDGSDNPAMDLSLAMTPTMLKPFAQSAANRSSFGSQIVPENTMTKERPDNLKMFRGTKNSLYDKAAQNIASFGELTGAGKYENDITKVSPETLKMLWRTYTGGLGTFVTDTMGATAMTVSDPKQVEATDWPILKDFWRDSGVKPIRGRYYDLTGQARSAITEFEQAKKAGDGEAMEKVFDDPAKAQAVSAGRMIKSVNKAAASIRDGEVDINARTDMTPSEKRAALKDLEKQEEELYRDAIEAFK